MLRMEENFVRNRVIGLLDEWVEAEQGIYREIYDETVEEQYREISLEEEIDEIFIKYGIKDFDVDIEKMFENPGVTIYSVSVAWVEGGELKSILNTKILFC